MILTNKQTNKEHASLLRYQKLILNFEFQFRSSESINCSLVSSSQKRDENKKMADTRTVMKYEMMGMDDE